MSVIDRECIKVISESCGIPNLSDEVALAIAPDAEYRVREIIQEALKFMRHSKRERMTSDDVSNALRLLNISPLFGYSSPNPAQFACAMGTQDLWFPVDKDLDLKEIIAAPLPKCPIETSFSVHWLAIDGVQPNIPQNPLPDSGDASAGLKKRKADDIDAEEKQSKDTTTTTVGGAEFKPLVKHILSKELQLYFDNITNAIKTTIDGAEGQERLKQAALRSLASDPGLSQLLPYFCQFIAQEVTNNTRNLPLLMNLMKMVRALLISPHLHIEPYLHHLIPSVLTCMVGKRLCISGTDNHWALRDLSAKLTAFLCKRFGSAYPDIQPRITKTLLAAFLDKNKPITTHYGAVQGLAALGPAVVQYLLLPNLTTYMLLLEPERSNPNPIKRLEADKCYGALLMAVGSYLRWFQTTSQTIPRKSLQTVSIHPDLQPLHPAQLYSALHDIFGDHLLPYTENLYADQASMLIL
eukprot:GILK01007461.1.p1 GENE.GILK01007461.1~~GILK01007461.1.p1  ORF type:complete len:481 (+),score=78.26 GILK01007461.1:44-1444(+)